MPIADQQDSKSTANSVEAPLARPPSPIKLFISYAHRDEEFRQELDEHLSNLQRQQIISGWHDRQITPGQEWSDQIDDALNEAQIILLLISSRFMSSDYCHDKEMLRAMGRHDAGEAVVIPIILSACDWQGAPFSKLQALPKDARSINSWDKRDEAWLDVVRGLRRVIERWPRATPAIEAAPVSGAPSAGSIHPDERETARLIDKLDFISKQRIVGALLDCDCLKTPDSRDQVVAELPSALGVRISRHSNARQDVLSIVNTCLQFPEGLKSLLDIVGSFEGDSLPWRKAQTVMREALSGSSF